ncbi:DUF1553 domain-containing protein [Thalassoroseus pseudoceratinae]|uniref:DUF1553 domain-containing protein n=1 Tax=Thalassoroseus pseudoceratinae TaxID=2713176 RepID=UPI0014237BA0|nr:DUF1553 domain-containing protein [Thalassoroseus pseudoceratinae]
MRRLWWCLFLLGLPMGNLSASELSLSSEIDRLIHANGQPEKFASAANDEEFLRRVYLDLAGRIPTHNETATFLNEKSPQKREKLIDDLLAGPDFPRQMAERLNIWLMERRGENDEWKKFLRSACEENQSWGEIVRRIIKPDDSNETTRGAAFFITQRLVSRGAMAPIDVPGLTRDVGRLFAGVDWQCAQCHDHLTVDDYYQEDFQGLHTIFEKVATRRGSKFPAIDEILMSAPQEFMSVFIQEPRTTPPRVPGGSEIPIPEFPKGEEYEVAPDRKKRIVGVPKFSPLRELANGLTTTENKLFSRNMANRLWWMMTGRGLVEPLDLHHTGNPATHPELLDLLASEFAAHNFDIKWLLREIGRSNTYQRSSQLPDESETPAPYEFASEKRLSAEQLFWSVLIATKEFDRLAEPGQSIEDVVAASKDLQTLRETFVDTFANPPTEPEIDFEPSVKAALYLMNGDGVHKLIAPKDGNLTHQLAKRSDAELTDELFLAILVRRPTDEERKDVQSYLAENEVRRESAIQNLIWALVSGTEFCLNH